MTAVDMTADRGGGAHRADGDWGVRKPSRESARDGLAGGGLSTGTEAVRTDQGHRHSFHAGTDRHDATRPIAAPLLHMLVTELGSGVILVQDCRTGAAVHVDAADSACLHEALTRAFCDVGMEIDIPPMVRPRIWHW
jgi:hypothetical protein